MNLKRSEMRVFTGLITPISPFHLPLTGERPMLDCGMCFAVMYACRRLACSALCDP